MLTSWGVATGAMGVIGLLGALVRLYASGFIVKNQELATDGAYRFVRHPLYTGNILLVTGFAIAGSRWWGIPVALLFFWFYYAMTGLHAVHLTIGVLLVATLAALARRGTFTARYHTPVEIVGLYWHLVDVIWVFVFLTIWVLQ